MDARRTVPTGMLGDESESKQLKAFPEKSVIAAKKEKKKRQLHINAMHLDMILNILYSLYGQMYMDT